MAHASVRSAFPLLANSLCTALVGLLLISIGMGCDRPVDRSSELLHVEARLQRFDQSVFEDCHASPAVALSPMQTSINSYLRDLATTIMERNDQSLRADGYLPVFTGDLSPEKFCYTSSATVSTYINAAAESQKRQISFLPYTFLALPQEPALAAVMCHELAHVTMRHGTSDSVRADIKEALMTGPGFSDRYAMALKTCDSLQSNQNVTSEMTAKIFGSDTPTHKQIRLLRAEITDYLGSHFLEILLGLSGTDINFEVFRCRNQAETVDALLSGAVLTDGLEQLDATEKEIWNSWLSERTRIEAEGAKSEANPAAALKFFAELSSQLDAAYGSGRNSFLSWTEQEADEVGFEMCLRAGVDVSTFAALHRMLVEQEAQGAEPGCFAEIAAGKVPDRKLGVHPTSCWRVFDIEVREQGEHGSYYKDLFERIPRRELLGEARLADVLQEIKSAVKTEAAMREGSQPLAP